MRCKINHHSFIRHNLAVSMYMIFIYSFIYYIKACTLLMEILNCKGTFWWTGRQKFNTGWIRHLNYYRKLEMNNWHTFSSKRKLKMHPKWLSFLQVPRNLEYYTYIDQDILLIRNVWNWYILASKSHGSYFITNIPRTNYWAVVVQFPL